MMFSCGREKGALGTNELRWKKEDQGCICFSVTIVVEWMDSQVTKGYATLLSLIAYLGVVWCSL